MTIHVKLITPITASGMRRSEHLDILSNSELKVTAEQIDMGPNSIECEYEEAMSQPGTILKIIDAEKEGCDAVVIDCMGDPGLQGARECVSIPVIGPCETAMHYASMLGHKFSVLTVLNRTVPLLENLSLLYGVSSKLASIAPVNIPVLELEKDLDYTLNRMTTVAIDAIKNDHAAVIIFGCTGMLGCADAVQNNLKAEGYDVPVIDPIPLAVNTAYVLAKLKLSQSKHSYPLPPKKGMVGFGESKLHII
jgi:allantoin racemase